MFKIFKTIKFAVITIVVVGLILTASYFANSSILTKNDKTSDSMDTTKVNTKTETSTNDNSNNNDSDSIDINDTNILLFGDSTDAMMVATLNNDTDDISLKSIDNDAYASITDTDDLLSAIEKNTNIDIDRFVQIDFKDLMNVVSTLGGIEVNVSEDDVERLNNLIPKYFAEVEYPKGSQMELIKSSGKQQLNSYQAIAYANVIADNSTKQKEVLTALIDQLKNLDLSEYPKIYNSIKSSIDTNLTLSDLVKLASAKLVSK